MEIFRELTMRGTIEQLEELISQLGEFAHGPWRRNHADRSTSALAFPGRRSFCFSYQPEEQRLTARLYLSQRDENELYVSNIVPWATETTQLTRAEYNDILLQFYRDVAPAAEQVGVAIEVTSDAASIDHWVSEQVAARLKAFSAAANRSTGTGHPLDHQRWLDFVIHAHVEDAKLEAATLARWFEEEEGWSGEKALDLSIQYDEARALLRTYDRFCGRDA